MQTVPTLLLVFGCICAQGLEVVGHNAAKVLTNFTNLLVQTPVDEAFQPMLEGLPFAEQRKVLEAGAPTERGE